jgi:Ca2+-binding RTX toxin-like protein
MKSSTKKDIRYLDAAETISNAVAGGASPSDPAVGALLDNLVKTFKPEFIAGTSGHDVLFASGERRSYVNGLDGDDYVIGSYKTDVLVGGAGGDKIYGLGGRDALFGGSGHDMLSGGRSNDRLNGGADNDVLEGGKGNDILTGGAGADRFIFNPDRGGEGRDIIRDFELGVDKIVLSVANVLASTPGLLALAGNPTGFDAEDLDVSSLWNLSASHDGDLVVSHPNGTIEIDGLKFDSTLTFKDILPAIDLIA